MTGLMLKDILVNKKYLLTVGGVCLLYIVYGFIIGDLNFFIPFLMLFCAMFILTTFSYDNMAGFDMYALTLPTTRNQIVYAKYTLAFLLSLFCGVLSILVSFMDLMIKNEQITKDFFYFAGVFWVGTMLFNCIQLPIVIKLGAEKARFAIIAVIFIPTLLIMGINKMGKLDKIMEFFNHMKEYMNLLVLLVPLVTILCFLLSMGISVLIFKNKEY